MVTRLQKLPSRTVEVTYPLGVDAQGNDVYERAGQVDVVDVVGPDGIEITVTEKNARINLIPAGYVLAGEVDDEPISGRRAKSPKEDA